MVKNLMAIAFGIAMATIIFFGFDEAFGLALKQGWIRKQTDYKPPKAAKELSKVEVLQYHQLIEKSPAGKWKHPLHGKEAQAWEEGMDHTKRYQGDFPLQARELNHATKIAAQVYTRISRKTVIDTEYLLDDKGRRIGPQSISPKTKIALFGCSYTFGIGVSQDQNTAAYLAKMRPDTQVYNYAKPGYGTADILYEIERSPWKFDDFKVAGGTAVYVFMDHHPSRSICGKHCLNPDNAWILPKPFFATNPGGTAEFKGFHQDFFPWNNPIIRFLFSTNLVTYYNADSIPLDEIKNQVPKYVPFLKSLQNQALIQKKFDQFVFAFFPGETAWAPYLIPELKKLKIPFLDYSHFDLELITNRTARIPLDWHPSPKVHWLFAWLLNRDLPKRSKSGS